jgi:hypothetical protein
MNNIYLLHSGSELIVTAIKKSKYCENIKMIDPTLHSNVLKLLRNLHFKSQLKSKKIWVDKLLDNVIENKKGNVLIIFDAPIWIYNISYIRKKYSEVRIIFWFWNIIKEKYFLKNIKLNCDKVFTFDQNEALNYQLEFHPQFYWEKKSSCEIIDNDIFFVGRNKNRIQILESIYLECKRKSLKVNFHIVKDKKGDKSAYFNLKEEGMSYSNVLCSIRKSKCILDINQPGQSGLTLRALEALFLKKKLISNNRDLIKYDFYNEKNILIINDKFEINNEFIDGKFVDIDEQIVEKYSVDNWIKDLIS